MSAINNHDVYHYKGENGKEMTFEVLDSRITEHGCLYRLFVRSSTFPMYESNTTFENYLANWIYKCTNIGAPKPTIYDELERILNA